MAKTKDLTQGNVAKLLLFFAFPTLLSNVFQQFYNLADTAIAGHILGDNALVAIGASSTINSLVLSFAWGLNGGFGIIIAQCFGAKDFKKLKKSVAISLSINVLFSLIVCKRIGNNTNRPLFQNKEKAKALYDERKAKYLACADIVIDGNMSARKTALDIAQMFKQS